MYPHVSNIVNKIIKINNSILYQLLITEYDLTIYSVHFSIRQIFKFLDLIIKDFEMFLDIYIEITPNILEGLLRTEYKDKILDAIGNSNVILPDWFWNKISPITKYNLLYYIIHYQKINNEFINKNITSFQKTDIDYIINYRKDISDDIINQLKILQKIM